MLQLSVQVNLLIETKLKEKCGKLRTEVKGMREVGLIVPDPRIHDLDPSDRVTVEVEGCN